VRLKGADGVKVMLIVQLALAATVPRQLSLALKSAGSAPVMAMLATVRGSWLVLVRVKVCAALAVPTF